MSDCLRVCRSESVVRLRQAAQRAAAGPARVLVTGEAGSGKDTLARFIHEASPRAAGPFVVLSCPGADAQPQSLPDGLDAAFADAAGGTLYLDEVSELALGAQARLLGRLDREPAPDAPRIIASTAADLGERVAHGAFREDLMYRLRVVHLHVPALRDRRDDIRPLVEHHLAAPGTRPLALSADAWLALEQYAWPGNGRELENVVSQLVWTCPDGGVRSDDLPAAIRQAMAARVQPQPDRRRQVADELFAGLVEGRYRFWEDIYQLFLGRDMTREDLRGVVRRGLAATRGSYRSLLVLFGMARTDYKRLLNFLAAHDCALDFREFRTTRTGTGDRRAATAADNS